MKMYLYSTLLLCLHIYWISPQKTLQNQLLNPATTYFQSAGIYNDIISEEICETYSLFDEDNSQKENNVPATFASKIIFFDALDNKNKASSYVIKVFNKSNFFSYSEEEELVACECSQELNLLIKNFEHTQNKKLPSLVNYIECGENDHSDDKKEYWILMSRAPGNSLATIKEQISSKQISHKQALDLGKSIGSQMGLLTKAFYTKNKSFLCHQDLTEHNLFFDIEQNLLTLIDLNGISEINYNPSRPNSYLQGECSSLLSLWEVFFPTKDILNNAYKQFLQNKQEELSSIKINIQVAETIFQHYYNEIKDLPPTLNHQKEKYHFTSVISKKINAYKEAISDICTNNAKLIESYLFESNINKKSFKETERENLIN